MEELRVPMRSNTGWKQFTASTPITSLIFPVFARSRQCCPQLHNVKPLVLGHMVLFFAEYERRHTNDKAQKVRRFLFFSRLSDPQS